MIISKEDGNNYGESLIVGEYKEVASRLLRLSFPNLESEEIEEALNYSIGNRIHNEKCDIYNNYKDKTIELTMIDICDYLIKSEPISKVALYSNM